nr:hypothetical protein [Haloarcula sp. CBA1115]
MTAAVGGSGGDSLVRFDERLHRVRVEPLFAGLDMIHRQVVAARVVSPNDGLCRERLLVPKRCVHWWRCPDAGVANRWPSVCSERLLAGVEAFGGDRQSSLRSQVSDRSRPTDCLRRSSDRVAAGAVCEAVVQRGNSGCKPASRDEHRRRPVAVHPLLSGLLRNDGIDTSRKERTDDCRPAVSRRGEVTTARTLVRRHYQPLTLDCRFTAAVRRR